MSQHIKSIAIFCGSNFGARPVYQRISVALGKLLAEQNISLIYGGTQTGLMGVVAGATLQSGGNVVGIIYQDLHDRGQSHPGLSHLEIAQDRRQRRMRMIELADAFIVLPGGLGTLEELFEVVTLTQLGDHNKPCGILNIEGFYDSLSLQLNRAVAEGFMKHEHRDMILIKSNPESLLKSLFNWEHPKTTKWIDQPQV
jgi:uncharacterized protein (TIGR00730 family)